MSVPAMPVVSMQAVSKVYVPSPAWMRALVRSNIRRAVVALDHVDLEVHPGQTYAVVGPNGAGKTTMFRVLNGLTTPTSGHARVLGLDAHRQSHAVRRLIGWMPAEERSLFMRLSCRENLHFHGRLQGMGGARLSRRIDEVLEQVGLGERARNSVFALSSGMRARLQLARALLHNPRLLILDEPTAAVDPIGAHQLLELITEVVTTHKLAALISSHRLEEIEALHSNVVLLDAGRIRHRGDLDELRARWDRPEVEVVFTSAEAAKQASTLLSGLADIREQDGVMLRCLPQPGVTTGDLLTALTSLLHAVSTVREIPVPLRDILASLYTSETPEPVAGQRAG